MRTQPQSIPVPAATVLMIRDGESGIEVLMVQRHQHIEIATGALVFPGGKVNQADFDTRLRVRCDDADSFDNYELAVRIACIREAFEECGILFAREKPLSSLVSAQRLKEMQPLRKKLDTAVINTFDFINEQELVLLPKSLVPFAHWITPEQMPKRFDTHFFIAEAPPEHIAIHDGHESVDSKWMTARQIIKESESGRYNLLFPTRLNLLKLSHSQTVAEAIARARATSVVTVCPEVICDAKGYYLHIPEDAGYDENTQRLPG